MTPTPAEPAAFFDIRDGRNVYERCPVCRDDTVGLGLLTSAGRLFVHCDCGHCGPAIAVPSDAQAASWPVPWHERDRLAFEAWNTAAVAARQSG